MKSLQSFNILFQKKKAKLLWKIHIHLLFTSMIQKRFIDVGQLSFENQMGMFNNVT